MNQEILAKFYEIKKEIESTENPYRSGTYQSFSSFYVTNFYFKTNDVIDKIFLNDFELYCIDAISGDKVVYPTQDYTLLSIKNKIVIAFHNYRNFTPKTYLYVEYKNEKELIQTRMFEDVQRFFHMGRDHSWGSFVFMGSRVVKSSDINNTRVRCDLNDYGPIYWNSLGETNENGNHDEFSETVDITRLQDFSVILSVPSKGHIVYLRLKPINGSLLSDDYNNKSIVPSVTRTLFESIKLIDEWSNVTHEPFNNTQGIAIKAKGFIEDLNIPEDVVGITRSTQADMQVYRYLSGEEDARQRPPIDEIALMPESVYSWFKQQYCYRDFDSLLLYHPLFESNG